MPFPAVNQCKIITEGGVAKEIAKDESAITFEGQAAQLVEACIIRRIGRLI